MTRLATRMLIPDKCRHTEKNTETRPILIPEAG
jgi:hypothetical protein